MFLLNFKVIYFLNKHTLGLVKYVRNKVGNIGLKVHFVLVVFRCGAILLLEYAVCKSYVLYVALVTNEYGRILVNEFTILEFNVGNFSVYVCAANNDGLTLTPPVACVNLGIGFDILKEGVLNVTVIAAENCQGSVGTDDLDIFNNDISYLTFKVTESYGRRTGGHKAIGNYHILANAVPICDTGSGKAVVATKEGGVLNNDIS